MFARRLAVCFAAGAILFLSSAAIFPLGKRPLARGGGGEIILLRRSAGARWIRAGVPMELKAKSGPSAAVYRKRFSVAAPSDPAVLTVRALGEMEAFLDDRPLGRLEAGRARRDAPALLPLPRLAPGRHELVLAARNELGPAPVFAECRALSLGTGGDWEAYAGDGQWQAVAPADGDWDIPLAREFGGGAPAFFRLLPFLLPLYAAAYSIARRRPPEPCTVRFVILGALVLLGLNNILRMPLWLGYDSAAHMRNIQAVAANWRLPAPDEGWQSFQAPLYYLLSAPLWAFFERAFGAGLAPFLIRAVPLACGVVQAELSYRAARLMFPERRDLQIIATLTGGLLPMNLYMSQYASNEPLAGCLSAAVIVLALSLRPGEPRKLALTGVVLGLALLSKVTALLLVPPLLLLLWTRAPRAAVKTKLADVGLLAGAAAATCGWYYVRNLLQFGRPLFLSSIYPVWWQDPGYRTPEQFFSFGRALAAPVYAGAAGLWDSLYSTFWLDGYLSGSIVFAGRPPWNYPLMLASAWLALAPAALMLAGAGAALKEPARSLKDGFLAVVGWPAAFLAAIAYSYLVLPVYSTGKASYMLGLTPCFALLAARGFDAAAKREAPKAALTAAVVCWAAAAYLSYFILSPVISAGP